MKKNNHKSGQTGFPEIDGNLTISDFNKFPFKTTLSLKPLIEFWEKETEHPNSLKSSIAKQIIEKVRNIPELHEPIDDLSIIEKHKEIVDLMMAVIYPPTQWDKQISASNIPFQFRSFYKTPSFERLFHIDENTKMEDFGMDSKKMFYGKTISAYLAILNKFYNIKSGTHTPMVFKIKDKVSLIYRYFQLNFDVSFVRPKCIGTLPNLTKKDIEKLLKDPYNLQNWMNYLPTRNFEFEGFVTFTAIDITDQESVSALKFDLLERESIISIESFRNLEDKLQSLFGLPDLKLGLAAIPEDWNLMKDYGKKIGDSFILSDNCEFLCENFNNSIYDKVEREGKTLIIEDIEKEENPTEIEKELLRQGIKNILVAPLYYKDQIIGVFELGSPNPGDINSLNWVKIKSVLMLFATAVKRSMEEFENKIQAVIKEEATAIHPSVEWRFRKAAVNLISKRDKEKMAEMEQIVFENVYPLYGLSDIRNSSDFRNESIKNDLMEHLGIAKNIINSAFKFRNLPILKELSYRIDNHSKKIESGINSGDELGILEFIQNELEPVFNQVRNFDPDLKSQIQNYYNILDPNLRILYSRRKSYEESVTLINETISKYLDECEEESQEMFPHYFEKYKTDGVEHGMYIGASLTEERTFDLIYLKNLRLWQLMTVCGIVKKSKELKSELKIPLETSHLILVQNNPLSIRFRLDEKKFDVDGTYNLRYEIMKKRIDKALIKGTKERLTQPGKVAVIYSQLKEANEYKRYLEYLENIGYSKGKIEDYELEDLQGVHGLKALRFTVNVDSKAFKKKINVSEIADTVNSLEEILN